MISPKEPEALGVGELERKEHETDLRPKAPSVDIVAEKEVLFWGCDVTAFSGVAGLRGRALGGGLGELGAQDAEEVVELAVDVADDGNGGV